MMRHLNAKHIFSFVLFMFILSLIPLYLIGIYAHPSVDDYYYGVETMQVWNSTHSLLEVLKTSFTEMIRTYYNWQGNFSAVFLMRLQPAIFGEEYYRIAPFVLITSFVLSSLLFYQTMLRTFFHAKKWTAGIISLSLTFLSVQLTHTPSDSFYWYNGAVYYTFFHSLMLLLFSLMAMLWKNANGEAHRNGIPLSLLSAVFAFFIGGGNFPTALLTALLLVIILFWIVYCAFGKSGQPKRLLIYFSVITISFFAGFYLSLTAPGNAIRQASVGGSTGLVKTFLYTFAYGGYSLSDVLSAPCIAVFVMLIPAFYSIAKRTAYAYRSPLLVFIFTFGLYCSLGTPVFYAQGLRMPYRITNVIYFSGYILIAFNLLYFLGWLHRKYGHTRLITECENFFYDLKTKPGKLFSAFCISMLVFGVTCVGMIEVSESAQGSGKAVFSNLPMSASAVYSLATCEAERYDRELDDRAAFLASTEEFQVDIAPLSVHPELIFHSDITEDAGHWKNVHLALYYGKESVRLTE